MICLLLFGFERVGGDRRELSQGLSLTPAVIHYAIGRGKNFLRGNKEVEEGLIRYLNNLTTALPASPMPSFGGSPTVLK